MERTGPRYSIVYHDGYVKTPSSKLAYTFWNKLSTTQQKTASISYGSLPITLGQLKEHRLIEISKIKST